MDEVNHAIITKLNEIAEEKGVRILFAVEAGSRVWRISSRDSDYDIRFVFVRNMKDYLRLGKLPDVIERKEGNMDIVGFDIYKFTKLLMTSNPSMIEWTESDIVYVDDGKTKGFYRNFIRGEFNPTTLYFHYLSMCRQNYTKYLKTSLNLTHKKYLYCMRGLVNALYVVRCSNIPPINFVNTILGLSIYIPDDVREKLFEIIELKKDTFEGIKVSKIHLFERYIEEILGDEQEVINRKIIDYSELQKYIYGLLGEQNELF